MKWMIVSGLAGEASAAARTHCLMTPILETFAAVTHRHFHSKAI